MLEFSCSSPTLAKDLSPHLEAVNCADFYVGPASRYSLVSCLAVASFCVTATQASLLDQLPQQLDLTAVGRDDSHSHLQCGFFCMRLCS